jgi:flagellar hook-associated protein 2
MSSASSAIFTGNSQFSSDFQQVISRAVSFASLPMQEMQSEVTTLQAQSSELSTLSSDFATLQAAISTLDSALGPSSYSASSSVNTVATASLSGTPSAGTYTVTVQDMGANASAMSSDGLTTVTEPTQSGISDADTYTLTVGDSTYNINTNGTTLSDLAVAINNSSAGVQATVVNVGSQGATDYRLSIQENQMAPDTIQLTSEDGSSPGTDLLSPLTTGAATAYQVNGEPVTGDYLTTSTPNITLAPGVTATLLAPGTTAITVAQNTGSVASALQSFVNAYNAIRTEINSNRGQGTGALQGQSILSSLSDILQQITGYSTGAGGISSLTSLGLEFDQNGVLSLDSSVFATATQGQITQLANFLGSTTTGGFLESANNALNGLTDPASGLFQSSIGTVQNEIAQDNQTIGNDQDRIDTLTTNLDAQMAAADTACATMEQQYSYLTEMFQQMQTNAQSGVY